MRCHNGIDDPSYSHVFLIFIACSCSFVPPHSDDPFDEDSPSSSRKPSSSSHRREDLPGAIGAMGGPLASGVDPLRLEPLAGVERGRGGTMCGSNGVIYEGCPNTCWLTAWVELWGKPAVHYVGIA